MPLYKDGLWFDDEGRDVGVGLVPARTGVTLTNTGTLVAAVANKRIRVYAAVMVAGSAVDVKFRSNTTDISATFPLAANGGCVLPEAKAGWFQTAVGEALNLNMSAATTVGVQLIYELVN